MPRPTSCKAAGNTHLEREIVNVLERTQHVLVCRTLACDLRGVGCWTLAVLYWNVEVLNSSWKLNQDACFVMYGDVGGVEFHTACEFVQNCERILVDETVVSSRIFGFLTECARAWNKGR